MDIEERINLVLKKPTEEVLTVENLRHLFEVGAPLQHYIGFEISGYIHLGTGLMAGAKIADFQKAGIKTRIFLADWHSWINDKLGGDLEVIQEVALKYFKVGMEKSIEVMGGDPKKVEFVLASEILENGDYWQTVIDISKNVTLSRVMRSITIMGRQMGESIDFAKLIYPMMQVADIFYQGVTIAHAGMDQRKAHVIAIEVAQKLKYHPIVHNGEKLKPVAVHHHLLLGLQEPPVWPITSEEQFKEIKAQMKMSKSKPYSAVFIHDSPEEIKQKLRKAFCPAREVNYNPVLDWAEHIIFREEPTEFTIHRPAKFGGDVTYTTFEELKKDFAEGKLHPLDLKNAVAEYLIELLKPIREYFERHPEPLELMRSVKITR
ncbi:tyrosine--tRNA ligase [Pyrococcus abyssi]|uniref:Tyrosine--tRNA ligase n=1 Tax=Pyrococcus abyssi (strain GE5 / Orsay) TaxID=272844 RepID=SYY_PYRAB|nr:tyrosine--tRNA ligase [Pyrococcus abyssi]Q9V027.1 RecName: Full=Tyrosine--tRNA ligase; AltName: Full=Tyrosyl-tRNA synthetase; Short=TyrRS [Pyrococcus abyssi GE5]CAB49879.1 tyrS tyrosyl-tRNA synthetase [Pyrococcus abyssi GE5]CCE70377.1 TPA: tyrosyl-tRNA synthetase [Pyrococcus abyssi GE5]